MKNTGGTSKMDKLVKLKDADKITNELATIKSFLRAWQNVSKDPKDFILNRIKIIETILDKGELVDG